MVKPPKKAATEEEKQRRIEALSHAYHSNRLEGDTRTWEEVLADPINQALIEGTITSEEAIKRIKAKHLGEQTTNP